MSMSAQVQSILKVVYDEAQYGNAATVTWVAKQADLRETVVRDIMKKLVTAGKLVKVARDAYELRGTSEARSAGKGDA